MSQPLHILVCNIRCVLSKLGELSARAEEHDVHVVLIQESWLDASIENPSLPGYVVAARRDRADHENRGGVLCYVRLKYSGVSRQFVQHCARRWNLFGSIA